MPYIGEIRLFAGNFPPAGWMFCHGQVLSVSEYEPLFQLVGTTYGGNGEETFQLPDLRGRVPLHQGTLATSGTAYQLGESGGVEEVRLTVNQIPGHTHPLSAIGGLPGTQASPSGALPAMSLSVVPYVGDAVTATAEGRMAAGAVDAVGGSQPHENMQPYLGLNFILSLFGEFPTS